LTNKIGFQWFDIFDDREGWDRQMSDLGNSVFHMSALLDVHRFSRFAQLQGILVTLAGRIRAGLGGVVDRRNGSFVALSFPRIEDAWAMNLPEQLIAWLYSQGVGHVEFGSFFGGVEAYSIPKHPVTVVQRLEFLLDLQIDPAERRKQVSSTMKSRLNKHLRQGFTVSECKSGFVPIINAVIAERLNRQGEMLSLTARVTDFVKHWKLVRKLTSSGLAKVYTLSDKSGTLLGATLMLEHKEQIFYMMGGCTKAGYEAASAFTLLWRLSEQYAEQGRKVLNLGGVPIAAREVGGEQHGLYRFKTTFGPTVIPRTSLVSDCVKSIH
jgi:hypothetical protein